MELFGDYQIFGDGIVTKKMNLNTPCIHHHVQIKQKDLICNDIR